MNKKDISQIKGIGKKTEKSLQDAGYKNIDDLSQATPDELAQVRGIGPTKALEIKEQVEQVLNKGYQEDIDTARWDSVGRKLSNGDEDNDDIMWEQKKSPKKLRNPVFVKFAAVSIVIAFAMGGILGLTVSHWALSQETDELHEKIDQLEDQIYSPQSTDGSSQQITGLLAEIEVLQNQIASLSSDGNNSSQINVLLAQINSLQDQVSSLLLSQKSLSYLYNETTLPELYKDVSTAIVSIHAYAATDTFFGIYYSEVGGSGFVYNFTGQQVVITNYHVVKDAINITMTLADGTTYPATVLGFDPYADLAVLSANSGEIMLDALPIVSSSTLEVGDPVIAIGNPFGLTGSMTIGIVSQLGRTIQESLAGSYAIANIIQVSTPINPGNSGGPLLNYAGEVVGITTAIIEDSQGVGFAIPSSTILREIGSLVTNGSYSQHSWLGVTGVDLTYEISQAADINATYGWLVASVVDGGPAQEAGIQGGIKQMKIFGAWTITGGDLIVAIDGNRIVDGDSMMSYLEAYTLPGQIINITVLRANQILVIPVELGVRPSLSLSQ